MQSFEQLHPRAVSVVIDPIQSVKGKVVIDAFRSAFVKAFLPLEMRMCVTHWRVHHKISAASLLISSQRPHSAAIAQLM